jgi:hypothetical protein
MKLGILFFGNKNNIKYTNNDISISIFIDNTPQSIVSYLINVDWLLIFDQNTLIINNNININNIINDILQFDDTICYIESDRYGLSILKNCEYGINKISEIKNTIINNDNLQNYINQLLENNIINKITSDYVEYYGINKRKVYIKSNNLLLNQLCTDYVYLLNIDLSDIFYIIVPKKGIISSLHNKKLITSININEIGKFKIYNNNLVNIKFNFVIASNIHIRYLF